MNVVSHRCICRGGGGVGSSKNKHNHNHQNYDSNHNHKNNNNSTECKYGAMVKDNFWCAKEAIREVLAQDPRGAKCRGTVSGSREKLQTPEDGLKCFIETIWDVLSCRGSLNGSSSSSTSCGFGFGRL